MKLASKIYKDDKIQRSSSILIIVGLHACIFTLSKSVVIRLVTAFTENLSV